MITRLLYYIIIFSFFSNGALANDNYRKFENIVVSDNAYETEVQEVHRNMIGSHVWSKSYKVWVSASKEHRSLTGTGSLTRNRRENLKKLLNNLNEFDPNIHSKRTLLLVDIAANLQKKQSLKFWKNALEEAMLILNEPKDVKKLIYRQLISRLLGSTQWIKKECRHKTPSREAQSLIKSATDLYLRYSNADIDKIGILWNSADCIKAPEIHIEYLKQRVLTAEALGKPYSIIRTRNDYALALLDNDNTLLARKQFALVIDKLKDVQGTFLLPDVSNHYDHAIQRKAWLPLYNFGYEKIVIDLIKDQVGYELDHELIIRVATMNEMSLVKNLTTKLVIANGYNAKKLKLEVTRELQLLANFILGKNNNLITIDLNILKVIHPRVSVQLLNLALENLNKNSNHLSEKKLYISVLTDLAISYATIGNFNKSEKYAREGIRLAKVAGLNLNSKLSLLLNQSKQELGDQQSAAQFSLASLKQKLDKICHLKRKNILLRELPSLPLIELLTNSTFSNEFINGDVVSQYIDCGFRASFKKKSSALFVDQTTFVLLGLRNDKDTAEKALKHILNKIISDRKLNRHNLKSFNDAAFGLVISGRGIWLKNYLPRLLKHYQQRGLTKKINKLYWLPSHLGQSLLLFSSYGTKSEKSYFTKLIRSSNEYKEITQQETDQKNHCYEIVKNKDCGFLLRTISLTYQENSDFNLLKGILLESMGFLKLAKSVLASGRLENRNRGKKTIALNKAALLARVHLKLDELNEVKSLTLPIFRTLQKTIALGSFGSDEALRWAGRQRGLYKTYMSALGEELLKGKKLIAEDIETAFSVTQYLQLTKTAGTFSQLSARIAVQSGGLARQHQDLNRKITKHYDQLLSANNSSAAQISLSIKQLEQKRNKITSQLQKENPDYFEHARIQILSIEETRTSLKKGEALISIYMGSKHTFLWWLDNKEIKLQVLNMPSKKLKDEIRNLRKGLERPDQNAFQMSTSFKLYSTMFSKLEAQLDDVNNLVFIPHGSFDSLPLSVLLRKKPEITEYKQDDVLNFEPSWLVHSHSVKVLPAISTIKILRKTAQEKLPNNWKYFGVGNPNYQNLKSKTDGKRNLPRNVALFPALPETEDEIRKIQKAFPNKTESNLLVGEKATEGELAKINLKAYDIISFATHAVISNELPGLTEPALILTPLSRSNESQDGILTAREIVALKLDAELVMLSACNTAAGDGTLGAEGLSGLAKAFFYAGSRNLLVTHWAIASKPAVDLAVGLMQTRLNGKAEDWSIALQQSVIDLMQKNEKNYLKHPSIWGAHMIVGAN